MPYSYRHLRAFTSVVRQGSITKAAAELNVSQPALTQSIRVLEGIVGTPLLDRSARGVEPTVAGAEFLAVAERLMGDMERSLADLRSLSELRRGRISIAGLPSVGCSFLPRLVADFRRIHPNLQVIIHDGLSGQVVDMVKHGHCDMALTCLLSDDELLHAEAMLEDDLILICYPGHRLAQAETVTWEAIAADVFIGLSRQSTTRILVDRAFAAVGEVVAPDYEVGHITTVASMVSEGLGITVIPRLGLSLVTAPNLVCRSITGPRAKRSMGLIRLAQRSLSPGADAFWAYVRDNIAVLADEFAPSTRYRIGRLG